MLSVYLPVGVLPGEHKVVEVIGDEHWNSTRGQEKRVSIYEQDVLNVCLFIAFYIHGTIFYICLSCR